MWTLIPKKKTPPTRLARYCCEKLKEGGGQGRMVVTGVRWAESIRRAQNHGTITVFGKKGVVFNEDNEECRRTVEQCIKRNAINVNPIIDWSNDEVWEFINTYNVPYCELYDQGYTRLGCVGCPMGVNQERELERWPYFKRKYLQAFEKMLKEREKAGLPNERWETAEDVMNWWLGKTPPEKQLEGQEMME
jgi:phosphoadenosine phosphosulfate reductase